MLTDDDARWLRSTGRDPEEIERQIGLLRTPPPPPSLDRPATVGDGIRTLDDAELAWFADLGADAAASGRVTSFVPASGAATRMAQAVDAARRGAASASEATIADEVVEHAESLALWPLLRAKGARAGDRASILDSLTGPDGIGLLGLPKGLVPFHRAEEGPRSPLHEHLLEALAVGRDHDGLARLHLTVGASHQQAFQDALAEARPAVEGKNARLRVTFSTQAPSTDTCAWQGDGLARDSEGRPLLRPGGHGALLHNLDALDADLVLMKNIDNVAPDADRPAIVRWRRALLGLLVTLQSEAHALVRGLRAGASEGDARAFLTREGQPVPEGRGALMAQLDRPWRVAGMVRNDGQPGGGPFWVRSDEGTTLQIVEAAQVGEADRPVLRRSTHFNPVELALGLRDAAGEKQALRQHTDPSAVILTEKVSAGRTLRVLEHPGLWNGQMARWNTVFVEVPPWIFRPVKTLADLLRAEHGGPLR